MKTEQTKSQSNTVLSRKEIKMKNQTIQYKIEVERNTTTACAAEQIEKGQWEIYGEMYEVEYAPHRSIRDICTFLCSQNMVQENERALSINKKKEMERKKTGKNCTTK